MKITQVTATCRRLIALPKYENVLYECSMTAQVEDGEDASKVYDDVLHLCKVKIGKELDRFESGATLQQQKKRIG